MELERTLRIVLENPPAGVDFGLQKGKGNDYETIQRQRARAKEISFEFTVKVKGSEAEGDPVFLGPFAQGPAGGRFVYIVIGLCAGQTDTEWRRRLKVPLSGITWGMIGSNAVLEARVPGTGKDGGPNCATVKPFGGWRVSPTN